nr:hypothetical protein [Chloroflexota bacterium]
GEAAADGAAADAAQSEPTAEPVMSVPVAITSGKPTGRSDSVIQTMPISRPMSWLRRDKDKDQSDH